MPFNEKLTEYSEYLEYFAREDSLKEFLDIFKDRLNIDLESYLREIIKISTNIGEEEASTFVNVVQGLISNESIDGKEDWLDRKIFNFLSSKEISNDLKISFIKGLPNTISEDSTYLEEGKKKVVELEKLSVKKF